MCLTTEAFAVFLNILGLGLASGDTHTITIHATNGPVTWHAVVDEWCTAAPLNDTPHFFTRLDAPQAAASSARP